MANLPIAGVQLVARDAQKFAADLGSSSNAIENMGKVALGIGAAGVIAVTGAVVASLHATLDWSDQLRSISKVLGTTSEQSAALAVAVEHVGGNTDDFVRSVSIMERTLESSSGKLGNSGKALKELGISFKDAHGNILPVNDLLPQVADKILQLPEGAERARAEMQLFGRSGIQMDTILKSLADGGLAQADAKAKALGLSLGGDTVKQARDMEISMNDIGLAAKGLAVSIGSEVLPTIAPLIQQFASAVIANMPTILGFIRDAFARIGEVVTPLIPVILSLVSQIPQLVSQVQAFIQPIIANLAQFVGWKDILAALAVVIAVALVPILVTFVGTILSIAAPIVAIIAAVALLRNAWESDFGGIRTTVTELWQNTIQPFVAQIIPWLQVNIPVALQTLSNFWTNVLQPAISQVWSFIQNSVFPLLSTLFAWLQTTIPQALQTLSGFWNDTLLPAITKVWAFINDSLVPLLTSLVNVTIAALKLALTALQGLWENILLPAITKVWDFINVNLMPIFNNLVDLINGAISSALNTLTGLINPIAGTFDSIGKAIDGVIGWLNQLATSIGQIQLPSWLTPHSPVTDFSEALWGIHDAFKAIATDSLPSFNAQIAYTAQVGGYGPPASASQIFSNSYMNSNTTNINLGGIYPQQSMPSIMQDIAILRALA